jgi:hypothetical protein
MLTVGGVVSGEFALPENLRLFDCSRLAKHV